VAAHGVAVSKVTGKFGSTDVRFGSKADVGSASVDVRFTPKADIVQHGDNVCFVPIAVSLTASAECARPLERIKRMLEYSKNTS
jgi:hypothetical protein